MDFVVVCSFGARGCLALHATSTSLNQKPSCYQFRVDIAVAASRPLHSSYSVAAPRAKARGPWFEIHNEAVQRQTEYRLCSQTPVPANRNAALLWGTANLLIIWLPKLKGPAMPYRRLTHSASHPCAPCYSGHGKCRRGNVGYTGSVSFRPSSTQKNCWEFPAAWMNWMV